MKAVVTGGAGLIGSHIVDRLLHDGHEVVVLDSLDPDVHPHGWPDWVKPSDTEVILGDIRSSLDLRCLKGADVVFHQAAYGGFAPDAMQRMADVNCNGTASVLESAAAYDVGCVVFASSQAVYGGGLYECVNEACGQKGTMYAVAGRRDEDLAKGWWDPTGPCCGYALAGVAMPEVFPVTARGAYALSKHFGERLVVDWGEQHGVDVVALRYSLTYGPRQSPSNPYTGIVSIFSSRILNGLRPVIYEDGQQRRDFTFVQDVAAAAIHCWRDRRAHGRVLNVGTGEPTAVLDLYHRLREKLGSAMPAELTREWRPLDARHLFTDVSELRDLDWSPAYSLDKGLDLFVEWWRSSQTAEGDTFDQAYAKQRKAGVVKATA